MFCALLILNNKEGNCSTNWLNSDEKLHGLDGALIFLADTIISIYSKGRSHRFVLQTRKQLIQWVKKDGN